MPATRDFTLSQLRYFTRAAELGTMTDAAADLFVAQSVISTAIQSLERTLGTQLFIRSRTRGLQLTAAGAELLARSRTILGAVEETLDAFLPSALGGPLYAGCFPTLAPFFLPRIILSLAEQHPDIEPRMVEGSAETISRALAAREIDIALTYDLGIGDRVRKELLATAPVYVAVAEKHHLALRGRVSLDELASEPMILLDMPFSRDYFLGLFTSRDLVPNVRYRFAGFEAVRAMVASGHGFALLNQRPAIGRSYDGSRLTALPLIDDVKGLDIVLATRMEEPLNARAEAFAQASRSALEAAVRASSAVRDPSDVT